MDALLIDLLLVLASGLAAGVVCRRLGVSILIGYIVAGALIGRGGLNLVAAEGHELKMLAELGALLLLFAIGIEFSIEKLFRLGRAFSVGGSLQMLLVGVPAAGVALAVGMDWRPALLVGASIALSSTVLVFKALDEYGQTATPHGMRAVGILLFQDVALVPLMLLVPLLTGGREGPGLWDWLRLGGSSALFVAVVVVARPAIGRWIVPALARLRSTELVVLFALLVLGSTAWFAWRLGLPPAIGAFAAGLVLSGNRLSGQVDALVLPYRETFAAVFFVSLGTLMRREAVVAAPWLSLDGLLGIVLILAGVLVLKSAAAAVAMRAAGLPWRAAAGMGIGLAQLGEFSFLLLSAGLGEVISEPVYNRVLLVALVTLILTPQLLKTGLRRADRWLDLELEGGAAVPASGRRVERALVVGAGPIGSQVASQLETAGVDVCLVDLSPVNLHPFAQQGFATVAGDASQPATLRRAGDGRWQLAVVTVPRDEVALRIVRAIRSLNRRCPIVVRCRFLDNVKRLKKAGANAVISEEAEASSAILAIIDQLQDRAEGRPAQLQPK